MSRRSTGNNRALRNGIRSAAAAACESLEARRLLATVTYVANHTTPGNLTDIALNLQGGGSPIEPAIAINRTNPVNLVPTSHSVMRISTNGGNTFAANTTFPNPTGTNTSNGDTDVAFDSDGRLYWPSLMG